MARRNTSWCGPPERQHKSRQLLELEDRPKNARRNDRKRIDTQIRRIGVTLQLEGHTDQAAIPAIARRLEELPAGRTVLAVIEIADVHEKQALGSAADVEVIWVVRGVDDLLSTVENLQLPGGSLYAWVATETRLSRQVRRVLLDKHRLDDEFVKAVGYWRAEGSSEE